MATTITTSGNLHTITGLTANENSDPLPCQKLGGILGTAHAVGSFGGGTVSIQVSLDGTNWFSLKDPFGDLADLTSDSYVEISTAANWIRASAGASVSSVDVAIVLRN